MSTVGRPRNRNRTESEVIGFGEYVDRQMAKVRTYVRLSDLAVATTTGILLVAALFFFAILVDHWIIDLGHLGRFTMLSLAIGVLIYVTMARVIPLLAKRLNPAYVAKIIETSNPSLKNSLLNFVLFRSQTMGVRKIVMDAVERQAAADLARVDVDGTIDHTPVIRNGTALGALMLAFACYAFFSPKDPLQSVARILMPWSDRARPSRVEIFHVEPGTTSVYAGRHLEISATIQRLRDDETAAILFTTADGQAVDSKREMEPSTTSPNGEIPKRDGRWRVRLPADGNGLHQDMTYSIVAGDAIAGPFRVKVVPAPSIVVTQLQYDYPHYMRREKITTHDAGEIDSVEGTRVTVRANANQQIESAYLEFDADSIDDNAPRQTIPMKHDGRDAWASFTLKLKSDRQTPWHANYRVRFRNLDQANNDRPAQYGIQVTPDLPPVVEILTPRKRDIDLPVNEEQWIEIRALDPDYGLEKIALKAIVRRSKSPIHEVLLDHDPDDEPVLGQRVVKYRLRPNKLGLRSGDIVDYRAVASDNRLDPHTGKRDANVRQTEPYRIEITAPDLSPKNQQNGKTGGNNPVDGANQEGFQDPTDKNEAANGQRQNREANGSTPDGRDTENGENRLQDAADGQNQNGQNQNGQNQNGQNQNGQNQNGQNQNGQNQNGQNQNGQNQNGQNQNGQNQNGQNQNGQNQNGQNQNGQNQNGQNQNGQNQNGQNQNGQNQNGQNQNGQNQNGQNQNGQNQNGQNQNGQNQNGQNQNGQNQNGQNQNGQNQNGQNQNGQNQNGQNQNGQNQNGQNQNGQNQNGQNQNGQNQNDSTDDKSPLPSDGSRDGDAMERILEKIREQRSNQTSDGQETGSERQQVPDTKRGDRKASDSRRSNAEYKTPNNAVDDSSNPSDAGRQTSDSPEKGQGEKGQGEKSQGEKGQGEKGQGEKSQGEKSQGEKGQGEKGQGEKGQGEKGQGEKGQGEKGQGEKGQGEKGQGEKGQGEKGQGEKGQGEKGQGEKSSSERSNGNSADGTPPNGQKSSDTRNTEQSRNNGQSGGDTSQSANGDASDGSGDSAAHATDIEADKANLEYAREATDLVLDYLKDQENRRDPELLDELGWTPDQLAEFARRWNQLKLDAERNDPVGLSARRELEDVLRSLGLAPSDDRKRSAAAASDELRSGNSGRRSKPPAVYRQRYERFLKSNRNMR